jgi:gluconolactonase
MPRVGAKIHESLRSDFHSLIDEHAPVRTIGSGFLFTEGPIWHPFEQYLLFSDIPASSRGRWDHAGGTRVHATATNKGNGMTRDCDLNLLVCEHATSSVARFNRDGTREVLATHFDGKELNSPNDIVVSSDGAIYFTDPTYGRKPFYGLERPADLNFQGVYRIPAAGGDPELLVERDMFSQPNGLCFSPDEALLYINDTEQANIRLFEVRDDTLKLIRIFASGISDPNKPGAPDGMKCDAKGNIWVTAPAGLWVYAPDGDLIGKVAIPEFAANLHWGGPDWRTLFITATTSVYALDLKVGPHVEPFMRVK